MAVTTQTLAILDQIRLDLDHRVDAETRLLTEAWARAWAELRPSWQQAIETVLAIQRTGKRPTRRQVSDAPARHAGHGRHPGRSWRSPRSRASASRDPAGPD